MFRSLFLTLGLFGLLAPAAVAQPSLDERDTSAVTVVLKDGTERVFQVYRDGRRREQFYYMPGGVRLFENTVGGKQVPQFTLVRYDFADQNNPKAPKGGVLQFAATMGATKEEIDGIRNGIPKSFNQADVPDKYKVKEGGTVQVACLPIKQAKVALYAKPGELIAAAFGEGAAPLSDTQRMIFQVDLTEAGVGVYDALTKAQGGVGVTVTVDFYGLTPEASVKITADYRQVAKHYSENKKTKLAIAASAWWGAVKANAEFKKDYLEAFDNLTRSGALKVEVYGTEKYDSAKLSEIVAPTLNRINQQILEVNKAPDKVTAASAAEPTAEAKTGGWGVAVAYGESVAVKNVQDVRDYIETVDLAMRDVVMRQTIVSGFIGVGTYPDEVKGQLYVNATRQFPAAVLRLPVAGDGFQSAGFETWVTCPDVKGTTFFAEFCQWKQGADSWKTSQDVPANYVRFPFTSLPDALKGKNWTAFTIHYKFTGTTAAGQRVERTSELPAVYGAAEATGVTDKTHEVVEVDWGVLPWATPAGQKQDRVVNVGLVATQGADAVRVPVRAVAKDGATLPPPPTRLYFPRKPEPVALALEMVGFDKDGNPVRKAWAVPGDAGRRVILTPLPGDFKPAN